MRSLAYLLFVGLILISCNRQKNNFKGEAISLTEVDEPYIDSKMLLDEAMVSDDVPDDLDDEIIIEKKIIKTGNISLETDNVINARKLIRRYVEQFNGWVSNEQNSKYDGRINCFMTVRLPADNFDMILDSISTVGRYVEYKSIYTQDVTEEFIDIEARLKTKKELEARYMELIKKASGVKDILSIEKELGILRAEIESIEGRYKYLKNSVAYSTLDINFYEQTSQIKDFGDKVVKAFKTGWEAILWVLIALVKLWAAILIIIVLVFVFIKVRQKH